jgi:hypothetical protein
MTDMHRRLEHSIDHPDHPVRSSQSSSRNVGDQKRHHRGVPGGVPERALWLADAREKLEDWRK